MYAAAGGASLAGRKARQHGRQPAPPSPHSHSPPHPAPTGVRAYSCQHWESRLAAPPRPLSALVSEPHSPCDLIECAAGRTAWQEAAVLSVGGGGAGAGGAARRCSVLGDHPGSRGEQPGAKRDPRKWHRNNRVRDASYGSSSESDGEAEGAPGEPWGVARLLYAGLGILALGLVVYFVGTGDKGFKTPALRLVGPSLIFTGLACCLLRITFCIFAKPCCRRRTNHKENRRLSGYGEGEEMPLAGGGGPRLGPAQCSPARRLESSSCDVSSLSSGEEDERMRRYRTASAPSHLPLPITMPVQQGLQQSAQQNTEDAQVPSRTQALRQTSSQSSAPRPSVQTPAVRQSASQPTALQPSVSQSTFQSTAVQPSGLQQSAFQPSESQPSMLQSSGSQQSALQPSGSQPSALQPSGPQPSALQLSGSQPSALQPSGPQPSALQPSGSQQSALQPSSSQQSAFHQPGTRRPPPRNVSFAGGPDGELVLSPAQLRS